MLLRTYLYAPGNRPDLLAKVLRTGTDAVIVDLEDAVPASEKDAARRTTLEFLERCSLDGVHTPVFVRVDHGERGVADVEHLTARGLVGLRVPKIEEPDVIRQLDASLARLEQAAGLPRDTVRLVPLVESVRGLYRLDEIVAASARVDRFAFGGTDFVRDIRGVVTRERTETFYARAHLVARSRFLGLDPPIAHVYTPVADLDGLRAACAADRALGFFGRSCIHPRQVAVVNEAFTPSLAEVTWARAVVAGYEDAVAGGRGSALLGDGTFVDEAVAVRARDLLALAAEVTEPGDG